MAVSLMNILRNVRKRYQVFCYGRRKETIAKHIFSKPKINVLFFAVNVGMWKNDGLFQYLLKDERFNPIIVSFLLNHNSKEYWRKVQDEMREFFNRKGYPYYDCYDFNTDSWLDIRKFSPDIIFYAQQGNYNSSHQNYRIDKLWHNSLFAYTPYCLLMENIPGFYNGLLTSIAWKVFIPTSIHDAIYQKYTFAKENNRVVVGCTFADDLNNASENIEWKNKDKNIKRIIWAPHHSILPSDLLNYSNFLEIAESMLQLAERYKDKIQIAFKPHPRLLDKLYKLEGWGVEKADKYYQAWADGENTMLVSGSYASLFKTSDAMIHDCSSFTGEYLYTGKPVMYLAKEDHLDFMNEFGRLCFEQHYKGRTINDVEWFINEVVIKGNDTMKTRRKQFYRDYLMPPNNRSVAENMYSEFANN